MEQGGCCLTRYRTLPSKADRIMSRYRPIAPKPAALTRPSFYDVNRTVSSVVSLDTAGCRPLPDTGKNKRVRKRRGDSLTLPQASKKTVSASGRSDSGNEHSNVSNCAVGSAFSGVAFAGNAGTLADPFSGGCVFAKNGMKSSLSVSTVESSEASVLGGGSVIQATGAIGNSGLIGSNRSMLHDPGFMKRAAARTVPSVLTERAIPTRCPGEFTEMIRGITRLSRTADMPNLMHPLGSPVETVQSISTDFGIALAPSCCTDLIDGEDEVTAVEQQQKQDDDGVSHLVTLPLLRDPPSLLGSSHSPVSTGLSVTQSHDLKNSHGDGIRDARFWFSRDECRAWSSDKFKYPKNSICDIALIKEIYESSQEPVLLMGESRNVLWLNPAYVRAYKDSMDRQAGKTPWVVPFIDPLGIPTELGKISLQLPGCGCSSATLWGFLRKFVVDAETEAPGAGFPVEFPLRESNLNSFQEACCRLGDGSVSAKTDMLGREANRNCGVIVPRPVRLVGSTVSLESITDVQTESQLLSGNLELVKEQLEEGNAPAFISDSSNKVRWVNTAYKQMTGQPECPWLLSTVNSTEMAGMLPAPRLVGEVLLTSSVEIPVSASAFSGRANIEWMNTGERNCMTVPCDVCRLHGCGSVVNAAILVWKFDIDASLRLTCGR